MNPIGESMQNGGSGWRPVDVPRRDALNVSAAAALGVTAMVLPNSAAAASIPVATSLVAPTGGIVYGWGTEFASGVFGTQSNSKTSPVEVTGNSFTWPEIVQVSVARYLSLALARNGDVYASGLNENGKIGLASVALDATVRTPVRADIEDVAQVAGGPFWVLALKATGEVWAWGAADAASGLGTETRTPADVTATLWPSSPPSGVDKVVQVTTNSPISIALTATGRVFTWGSQASEGALGQGSTSALTSASAVEITTAGISSAFAGTVASESRIIQVSAGLGHALALGLDGRVFAWGRNGTGQVGDGSTTVAGAAVEISSFGALSGTVGTSARVVQVSAGDQFSLAVGLDGAVYAWGTPNAGRLGNGTTTGNVTSPQLITGVTGSALPAVTETSRRIVQVSARGQNGYALGADARVYGWGGGGGVGDGTTTLRTVPVEITGSGAFANLSPNPGASLAPRRIVGLATGAHNDAPHMLAIDDRG